MKFTVKFSITSLCLVCFICNLSCKKQSQNYKPNAVVRNYLSSALGGCDWVIELGDQRTIYSPLNLDDAYKKDGLKVIISYHLLDTKKACGGFVVDGGYRHLQIDELTVANDQ